MTLRGSLMVCGTASDVGKSRIVAGLCRVLAREGVAVAPFKAQNMALNSFVTDSGHEIARSVAHQAAAARIVPRVEMNPILLKPTDEMRSQLIVMGRPAGDVIANDYPSRKMALESVVLDALEQLRSAYDVVIAEGAGGAAEINLLDGDLVNLPLARRAGVPTILIGDIERGGVFASLYGTVALLPDELRAPLGGFVVNKMRGEARLLTSGIAEVERRSGMPCLGVLPHLGDLLIDAEDSLALEHRAPRDLEPYDGEVLDVAIVRLPRLANFTDFDPLAAEPGVALRYVASPGALERADLIVLPGSKATVDDLAWLRARGIDHAIGRALEGGSALLGICAGYQMLGASIVDEVESHSGEVVGLGLIAATTHFSSTKRTRQRHGVDLCGTPIAGYEIHHGEVAPPADGSSWFGLDSASGAEDEGVCDEERGLYATSLHGLFESDPFRRSFLASIASRRNKHFVASSVSFGTRREQEIDCLADALEAHLDLSALHGLIAEGIPR